MEGRAAFLNTTVRESSVNTTFSDDTRISNAPASQVAQATQGFCTVMLVVDATTALSGALDSDPTDCGSALVECKNTVGGSLTAFYSRAQRFLFSYYFLKGLKGGALRDRVLSLNILNVYLEKKLQEKGASAETSGSSLNVGGFVMADKQNFSQSPVLCIDKKVMKTRRQTALDIPVWVVVDATVPLSLFGGASSEVFMKKLTRLLEQVVKVSPKQSSNSKRRYSAMPTPQNPPLAAAQAAPPLGEASTPALLSPRASKAIRAAVDSVLQTEVVGLSVRSLSFGNALLMTLRGSGWQLLVENPVSRSSMLVEFEREVKSLIEDDRARTRVSIDSHLHQGQAVVEVSFGEPGRRRDESCLHLIDKLFALWEQCAVRHQSLFMERQKSVPKAFSRLDTDFSPGAATPARAGE